MLNKEGKIASAWAVENGIGEAVMKMSFGNRIGFKSCGYVEGEAWHTRGLYDFIVAELTEEIGGVVKIGETTAEPVLISSSR